MGTVLLNLTLLVGAFMSVQIALGWGEAASYPLGGDKSSLAGFGGMMVIMMIRWLALAPALAVGAARGAFEQLPGGRLSQVLTAVTLHIVLGVVSLQLFNWVIQGIQADNPGPQRLAWLPGLVLPVAVIMIAFWAVNRDAIARRPWIGFAVFVVLVLGHWAGWRQGYSRPTPSATTTTAPSS